ncbi:MAG: hypothetical protein ACTS2F_18465 [Thainema sp.]
MSYHHRTLGCWRTHLRCAPVRRKAKRSAVQQRDRNSMHRYIPIANHASYSTASEIAVSPAKCDRS